MRGANGRKSDMHATAQRPLGSARRRRRRLAGLGILVALALLILGIGLQSLGHGGGTPVAVAGALPPGGGAAAAPARTVAPAVDVPAASAAEVLPVAMPANAPPATALPAALPLAAPDAVLPPAAGDADRFACLLALVQSRGALRRFGDAETALGALAGTDLAPGQAAQVRRLGDGLARQRRQAAAEVAAQVRQGRVLAVRAALAPQDLASPFGAELAAALAAGFADWCAPPTADRAHWPVPAPLAREAHVRTVLAAQPAIGVVVDSRSDAVTLRVETTRGQTFPTVPVVGCEPVAADAPTAGEMGFAALQAGDPVLARLWLCAARARGTEAPPQRVVRLAELLP